MRVRAAHGHYIDVEVEVAVKHQQVSRIKLEVLSLLPTGLLSTPLQTSVCGGER